MIETPWVKLHREKSTGIHGAQPDETLPTASTSNKKIYVDGDASGAEDGSSWTNAFTSIQDAIDALPDIVLHAYTIYVRSATEPYRETVYLNSDPSNHPCKVIAGSLTIEAEYYWQGDCEANIGGAGEITDNDAFGNVAVGDKVLIYHITGDKMIDYEVCTVDDVTYAPNRIGTNGSKIPTIGWSYIIVRTEISGSDDGTDGGTSRNNCIFLNGIDNVTINGFYYSYSDQYAVTVKNSRNISLNYLICHETDSGIYSLRNSVVDSSYGYYYASDAHFAAVASYMSLLNMSRAVFSCLDTKQCVHCSHMSELSLNYFYIDTADEGIYYPTLSYGSIFRGTISSNVTTGIYTRYNASIYTYNVTNNATTAEDPAGTTEGAYIG